MLNRFLSTNHLALKILIFSFPITFLSIKHGVHISLYGLSIIGIFYWLTQSQQKLSTPKNIGSLLIIFSLASIFIATALSNTLKFDMYWPSFDGPSRLLFAAIVFSYLKTQSLCYSKILKIAIPIGLILSLVLIFIYPETTARASGKFATSFVDPNILGSQSLILGTVCLLLIRKNISWQNLLLIIGAIIGFYLSIHAGSRGGWLALPLILIAWFFINTKGLLDLIQLSKPKKIIFIGCSFIVLIIFSRLIINIPIIATRIEHASADIAQLLMGDFNTSIGARIAMWIISFQYLIPAGGLLGIGEMGVKVVISSLPIDPIRYSGAIYHLSNTGPHSDLLAKLLSMGYIGGVSYLLTVLIPTIIFLKNIKHIDRQKSEASQIGFYYILGIIICGLSNEMLSLKYLCSFYGLMIACLAADVLRDNRTLQNLREK